MLMNLEAILNHKKSFIPESGYNVVGVDSYETDPEDVLTLDGHYKDHAAALARLNSLNSQNDGIKYYIYDKNTE